MPVKKRVVCAVDGGGTKTLAVVTNMRGKEIARAAAGPSNYVAGEAGRVVENVTVAVEEAVRGAKASLPIDALWVGLAGIDRPGAREEIGAQLAHLASEVRMTNDADLLFDALSDGIGVVLIAGTGSIARGRDRRGKTARAGGWGYQIGDEGSGYDMGRRAIQAVTQAADGRGKETVLLPKLLAHWELEQPLQIIDTLNRAADKKALIAACARLVVEAEREMDRAAYAIMNECSVELADMVIAVVDQLDFMVEDGLYAEFDLVMAGSLLVESDNYRDLVFTHIEEERYRVRQDWLVREPALTAAQRLVQTLLA